MKYIKDFFEGARITGVYLCKHRQSAVTKNGKPYENVILQDKVTNYREKIMLKSPIEKPICIGFDSRLVLETIKAFTCENITLNFSSPSAPMIVQAEDSDMKALVLPVRLRGTTK